MKEFIAVVYNDNAVFVVLIEREIMGIEKYNATKQLFLWNRYYVNNIVQHELDSIRQSRV